jgi:hypothetical protein
MNAFGVAWNRFWFTPADPTTLGAVRICTGLILLFTYLSCTPSLLSFVGPNAWIDAAVVDSLRSAPDAGGRWWGWSIYFVVRDPWAVWLTHLTFLAFIVCFTVGLFTRVASVVVWAGHLCFLHRAFLVWSGMDSVLAMLTFYLMFAPSGAALSLDRLRLRGTAREMSPAPSWSANVAIRLIQVHMGIIYLCAGLSKLQGARWWDGTAVWTVMTMQEFAPFDWTWLGLLGDVPCLLISNVGVLLTLGFEISFVFLIWNPRLRPVLLSLAVLLHAGIGLFMGMSAFGAAMLAGCLSFVDPGVVRKLFDSAAASTSQRPMASPETIRRKAA